MGYSSETNQKQAQYKKKSSPRWILKNDHICHKCNDSKHIEGFQCSACKYQCKNCHRFCHLSSFCYKKQESFKHTWSISPKAYQLTGGRLSTQDNSICCHSSDNSSSDESFCLQMKLQAKQANTNYPAPQHLLTNLEVNVKPHRTKTKFLHARLDTCADVNTIPYSVYQLLFKDPDCTKLAPSDLQLGTYTDNKVKLIGVCELYVVHPTTKTIEAVILFVACNEGSVLISCTTSLALGLIKPHASIADQPRKKQVTIKCSYVNGKIKNIQAHHKCKKDFRYVFQERTISVNIQIKGVPI